MTYTTEYIPVPEAALGLFEGLALMFIMVIVVGMAALAAYLYGSAHVILVRAPRKRKNRKAAPRGAWRD